MLLKLKNKQTHRPTGIETVELNTYLQPIDVGQNVKQAH